MNPYQNYTEMNPQYYNPKYYNPNYQITQPRNNRIWVQGETGAKSYLVAPNASVDMWDSEAQTIYVKTTDAAGMPTMQILDYTIRGEKSEKEPIEDAEIKYASVDELNELKREIRQIKGQLKNVSQSKTLKKGTKSDE